MSPLLYQLSYRPGEPSVRRGGDALRALGRPVAASIAVPGIVVLILIVLLLLWIF